MDGENKKRFDPNEIFNIKGSWLNLIEDHTAHLAKLEKRVKGFALRKTVLELFTFQNELWRAHVEQLAKVAGIELDPYAWDYADAYSATYASERVEQEKSAEEAHKAADRAGMIAKAKAIAADTAPQAKPRISRAGVIGEAVES